MNAIIALAEKHSFLKQRVPDSYHLLMQTIDNLRSGKSPDPTDEPNSASKSYPNLMDTVKSVDNLAAPLRSQSSSNLAQEAISQVRSKWSYYISPRF